MHSISIQISLAIAFHIFGKDHHFLLNDGPTRRSSCVFWCILISRRGVSRYYLKATCKYDFSMFTYQGVCSPRVCFHGLRLWVSRVWDCFMLPTWLYTLRPWVLLGVHKPRETDMEMKGVAATADQALMSVECVILQTNSLSSDENNSQGKE